MLSHDHHLHPKPVSTSASLSKAAGSLVSTSGFGSKSVRSPLQPIQNRIVSPTQASLLLARSICKSSRGPLSLSSSKQLSLDPKTVESIGDPVRSDLKQSNPWPEKQVDEVLKPNNLFSPSPSKIVSPNQKPLIDPPFIPSLSNASPPPVFSSTKAIPECVSISKQYGLRARASPFKAECRSQTPRSKDKPGGRPAELSTPTGSPTRQANDTTCTSIASDSAGSLSITVSVTPTREQSDPTKQHQDFNDPTSFAYPSDRLRPSSFSEQKQLHFIDTVPQQEDLVILPSGPQQRDPKRNTFTSFHRIVRSPFSSNPNPSAPPSSRSLLPKSSHGLAPRTRSSQKDILSDFLSSGYYATHESQTIQSVDLLRASGQCNQDEFDYVLIVRVNEREEAEEMKEKEQTERENDREEIWRRRHHHMNINSIQEEEESHSGNNQRGSGAKNYRFEGPDQIGTEDGHENPQENNDDMSEHQKRKESFERDGDGKETRRNAASKSHSGDQRTRSRPTQPSCSSCFDWVAPMLNTLFASFLSIFFPDRSALASSLIPASSSSFPSSSFISPLNLKAQTLSVLRMPVSSRWSDHSHPSSSSVTATSLSPSSLTQLISVLTRSGFQVRVDPHRIDSCVLLKLYCNPDLLEETAETIGLRMRLKNGGFSRFHTSIREEFLGTGDPHMIFRSSERQSLIEHLIKTIFADGNQSQHHLHTNVAGSAATSNGSFSSSALNPSSLSRMILTQFPLHMYARLQQLESWLVYWNLRRSDSTGLPILTGIFDQPLDSIASYYGEEIAFYYAWLGFYTKWLCFPCLMGLILFCTQLKSSDLDSPFVPFFCIGMCGWATLLLVYWKRESTILAYRWGVLNYEAQDESIRPEYTGELRFNPSTNHWEKEYPKWKRAVKMMVTVPVVIGLIAGFSILMLWIFVSHDRLVEAQSDPSQEAAITGDLKTYDFLAMFNPDLIYVPVMWGLVIPLSDLLFTYFAAYLTNFENWKTHSIHHRHLILKIFTFRFFNSFLVLYYYAVADLGILRLTTSVMSFLCVSIFLRLGINIVGPRCWQRWQQARIRKKARELNKKHREIEIQNCKKRREEERRRPKTQMAEDDIKGEEEADGKEWNGHAAAKTQPAEGNQAKASAASDQEIEQLRNRREEVAWERANGLSQAWIESTWPEYNNFEDYAYLCIQFGYVCFFSVAFPFSPWLALLSNVIEIRCGAYKLCKISRRPRAIRSSGIGVWLYVLQCMSVCGVLTNCVLIGFTSHQTDAWYPGLTSAEKICVIFVFEHIMIAIRILLQLCIVPIPADVARQMTKERKEQEDIQTQMMEIRNREKQEREKHLHENIEQDTSRHNWQEPREQDVDHV